MSEAASLAVMRPHVLADRSLASAEQLELIADEMPQAQAIERVAAARGRGRPAGARNKRTEDWATYILGRYPSPLIGMAETYSRSVQELAAELSCSLLEAYQVQAQARRDVAPYLHSKRPLAIDVTSRSDMTLILPGFNSPAQTVDAALEMQIIDNQSFLDEALALSDDESRTT